MPKNNHALLLMAHGGPNNIDEVESSYVTEDNTQIDYYFISKFSGERGFHSKLFGDHPTVEEGEKLFEERKPSSHGCVRLEFDDAKWLYSLPLGTPVHIF